MSLFLPLADIHKVEYHINGDLFLLLRFHLGRDGFKMLGKEVLDSEKPWQPRNAVPVVHTHVAYLIQSC